MGQTVTVANASGDKLYVKVQSPVEISEKTDFVVGGSTPTIADGSATGKVDVEVNCLVTFNFLKHQIDCWASAENE